MAFECRTFPLTLTKTMLADPKHSQEKNTIYSNTIYFNSIKLWLKYHNFLCLHFAKKKKDRQGLNLPTFTLLFTSTIKFYKEIIITITCTCLGSLPKTCKNAWRVCLLSYYLNSIFLRVLNVTSHLFCTSNHYYPQSKMIKFGGEKELRDTKISWKYILQENWTELIV